MPGESGMKLSELRKERKRKRSTENRSFRKLSFRYEREMKTFSDIKRLREFVTTDLLQEC